MTHHATRRPIVNGRSSCVVVGAALWLIGAAAAQMVTPPAWRHLGPVNMSGRIVDLAVNASDVDVCYAATASGGLFKSTNQGTTWRPVFDRQETVSLGAVAVSPADPQVVWVGTGEANARNSVSWGNGVYLSRDGGENWKHTGLDETFQIGRIAPHPTDASVALVAACGRLWGPNPERGVYRTDDGGSSWQQVLKVDDATGAVEVLFDPSDPARAYAATWTRRRGPWDSNDPEVRFGDGAGVWRSADGGRTWSRLTAGLPSCKMGRIGLTIAASQPKTLYAVIATERLGEAMAAKTENGKSHPFAERLGGQVANKQDEQGADGFEAGGVFRSDDGGDSWRRVNSLNPRPYYYSQIRVDPTDPERVWVLGTQIDVSTNGGKTFERDSKHGLHVDFHALWIDPANPERLLIGTDGGVAFSVDRGDTWRHCDNLPAAQYYRVSVDDRVPYRVYGGLQDNGTWVLPSRSAYSDGVLTGEVACIGWGDGFTVLPHPEDPDLVFSSSQYGVISYSHSLGNGGRVARPKAEDGEKVRFQWDTPYLIDPHDADRLWVGAHRLIAVDDRGAKAEWAGPELAGDERAAITALAASLKTRRMLWAGTADGRIWYTRSAGSKWKEFTTAIPDLPGPYHVSDIECSFDAAGTVWVAFDGHRSDDHGVFLYRTTNSGRTWKRLGQDIDRGPVLALQQGTHNEDLLFVGTEFGAYGSLDGGDSFFPLRGDLPTVAVRDFAIQARERELIAGTHGRGVFVLDIAGLEALDGKTRQRKAVLLPPRPAVLWDTAGNRRLFGDAHFRVPNPPRGTALHVWLGTDSGGDVELAIASEGGEVVRKLELGKQQGLHRVFWDLRKDDKRRAGAGTYRVQLTTAQGTQEQEFDVLRDPRRETADSRRRGSRRD